MECYYQGQGITPEMPGCCSECVLFLNTCLPFINNGFVVGECDLDYCLDCPYYYDCDKYKGGKY